jgi:hypothetical protein
MRKAQKTIHNFGVRYAEEPKEYIKEYMRMYNSEKVVCSCGKLITKGAISRHLKRMTHLKKVLQQN